MRLNYKITHGSVLRKIVALSLIAMVLPIEAYIGARAHLEMAFVQVLCVVIAEFACGKENRNMHRCVTWIFAIYAAHLISVLFLDHAFGREISFGFEHLKNFERINLMPFRTIENYIRRLADGKMNIQLVINNLLGNVFALAPLGIFLPMVFEKMKNIWASLAAGAGIIILIETVQILTNTGSFDVDDFILNFAGFAIARLIAEIAMKGFKMKKARAAEDEIVLSKSDFDM